MKTVDLFRQALKRKKRAAAFRRRRANFQPAKAGGLQIERLIENNLAALNNDDFGGSEGDVSDRSSPVIVRATGLFGGRIWRRRSGQTRAKIAVLDFGGRKRLGGARLDRNFVLSGRGRSTLVGAKRGRGAGGFHGDGDIGVAEASEAEAALQRRALIAKGRRGAAFEMNARGVSNAGGDERRGNGEGEWF